MIVPERVRAALEERARFHDSTHVGRRGGQGDAKRSPLAVTLDGEVAEWIVARLLGMRQAPIDERGRGDLGVDLSFRGLRDRKTRTIQVKATRYASGVLLFPSRAKISADVFVLVRLRAQWEGDPAGWVKRSTVERLACPWKPGRLGTEVFVERAALRPFGVLAERVLDLVGCPKD